MDKEKCGVFGCNNPPAGKSTFYCERCMLAAQSIYIPIKEILLCTDCGCEIKENYWVLSHLVCIKKKLHKPRCEYFCSFCYDRLCSDRANYRKDPQNRMADALEKIAKYKLMPNP